MIHAKADRNRIEKLYCTGRYSPSLRAIENVDVEWLFRFHKVAYVRRMTEVIPPDWGPYLDHYRVECNHQTGAIN